MHKLLVCTACEAEFKLRHDLDPNHYEILFCPFCGAELEPEENYQFDEDDSE